MHDLKAIRQFFEHHIFDSNDEESKVSNHSIKEKKMEEKIEASSKESPQKEKDIETKKDQLQTSELKIKTLKEGIITQLSKYFLLTLFDYFDPLSLAKFGMSSKYMYEVSNHIPLYKKFCIILFSKKFLLPDITPFVLLQDYIKQNPLEFDSFTIARANFDIRSIIWGSNNYLDEFKTMNSFYKQFENWKNCFQQAPRICLKGYYLLKEKYLKTGEKDFNQTYDPIWLIEFYRYMRFYEDGLVVMLISSSKIPHIKLKKMFQKALNCEQNNDINENPLNLFINLNKPKNEMNQTILKGEYMRKEGKIYAKFCSKGSSFFEYELLIKSSQGGKNDLLFVLSRINRELTTNYIRDDNDQRASGMKVFEFKKVNEFGLDIIDLRLKSVTL